MAHPVVISNNYINMRIKIEFSKLYVCLKNCVYYTINYRIKSNVCSFVLDVLINELFSIRIRTNIIYKIN